MAGSPIRIGVQGGANYLGNVDALVDKIKRIPGTVRSAVRAELQREADELADFMKTIAPVAHEFEKHPGDLRNSIHTNPGRTELAVQVIADAKDEKGRVYAAHVEFGHRAHTSAKSLVHGGSAHVAPKPFFYPAIRVTGKARARAMRKVLSTAFKAAAG